jgi:hypothetical protein
MLSLAAGFDQQMPVAVDLTEIRHGWLEPVPGKRPCARQSLPPFFTHYST